MKPYQRYTNIILPTDEVFTEYAPYALILESHSRQLKDMDLTLRGLAEYVLFQWIACASLQQRWALLECPHHAPWTLFDQVINYLYLDCLSEQVLKVLDPRDAMEVRTVGLEFGKDFYRQLIPQLDQFDLTDYQIETMELKRWLGHSPALEIAI